MVPRVPWLTPPSHRSLRSPAAISKELDTTIWTLHAVVMVGQFLEIALRSYSQRGFFGSFYFLLDLIATFTIIIDFQPLFQSAGGTDEGSSTDVVRAAKSARVGTRIARLTRVVRVIRVIKLFVSAYGLKKNAKDKEEEQQEDEGAPSELSKALQGTIAKKTIVFVLTLLAGSVGIEFGQYAGIDVANLGDMRARMGMAQLFSAISPQFVDGGNINAEPFLTMRKQFNSVMDCQVRTDAPRRPRPRPCLDR